MEKDIQTKVLKAAFDRVERDIKESLEKKGERSSNSKKRKSWFRYNF